MKLNINVVGYYNTYLFKKLSLALESSEIIQTEKIDTTQIFII